MASIETLNNRKVIVHMVAYEEHYKFVWYGGQYVDVFLLANADQCVDLINVFDYEAGETRLPFTPEGLAEAISEWLEDRA